MGRSSGPRPAHGRPEPAQHGHVSDGRGTVCSVRLVRAALCCARQQLAAVSAGCVHGPAAPSAGGGRLHGPLRGAGAAGHAGGC